MLLAREPFPFTDQGVDLILDIVMDDPVCIRNLLSRSVPGNEDSIKGPGVLTLDCVLFLELLSHKEGLEGAVSNGCSVCVRRVVRVIPGIDSQRWNPNRDRIGSQEGSH